MMMRKLRFLIPVLLLGIAIVASACGGGKTPADPNRSVQDQEVPAPSRQRVAEEGETLTIDIVDFAYDPQEVTVAPGTTITWTNEDTVAHTVTADDGTFDSGNMNNGDTWSYTFNEPGEYPYYCIPHPYMTATVIVKE